MVLLALPPGRFLYSFAGILSRSNFKEEPPSIWPVQKSPPLCSASDIMCSLDVNSRKDNLLPWSSVIRKNHPKILLFLGLISSSPFSPPLPLSKLHHLHLYSWSSPLTFLFVAIISSSPCFPNFPPPNPSCLFTIPLIMAPKCKYENVSGLVKMPQLPLIKC